MKIFITVFLVIGSVAASGSGPYLPSGWRPQGPAFYLPTENQAKPVDNPVKVTIFQENEASGSENLREYGPPKLQEVTSFGNQGLPDIVTEQIFQIVDVQSSNQEIGVEENLVTEDITEEKSVVTENVADTKSNIVEETKAVTESETEKVIITESLAEEAVAVTEKVVVEDAAVTQTSSNEDIASTQSTVVEENADLVVSEPKIEGRSLDVSIQADFEETTQIATDAAESAGVTLEVVEATEKVEELKQGNEEIVISTELSVETEKSEVTTLPALVQDSLVVVGAENTINVETASEEKSEQLNNNEETVIAEVTTNLKEIENVAAGGVNNIAEALVKIENEIEKEQVTTEEKKVQENSGPLEQGPEGFLEYGPPGFREYGPPKGEDLLKALDQGLIEEGSVATNELRRRRFSPKFRPSKRNH